jgi:ABC-type dipeptide/oligopeptide/nickel transport system permease subunit
MIVLGLIFCAIFAEILAPHNPAKMGTGGRFLPPSGDFPLGTDEFGRDMLSRILYGSRITLLIGAVAVGISMTVGMLVGMLAAFHRGWLEMILMRSTDVLFSFTETLIALSFVAVLGPSLQNAVIAVGVAGIPFYARTCYSAALVETSKPYFEASISAGAGPGTFVVFPPYAKCFTHDDCCGNAGRVNGNSGRCGPEFFRFGSTTAHFRMGVYVGGVA